MEMFELVFIRSFGLGLGYYLALTKEGRKGIRKKRRKGGEGAISINSPDGMSSILSKSPCL